MWRRPREVSGTYVRIIMEIKQGYDGGKVTGREKGEERDVCMYEGNTDGGIIVDKDLLDLFV